MQHTQHMRHMLHMPRMPHMWEFVRTCARVCAKINRKMINTKISVILSYKNQNLPLVVTAASYVVAQRDRLADHGNITLMIPIAFVRLYVISRCYVNIC